MGNFNTLPVQRSFPVILIKRMKTVFISLHSQRLPNWIRIYCFAVFQTRVEKKVENFVLLFLQNDLHYAQLYTFKSNLVGTIYWQCNKIDIFLSRDIMIYPLRQRFWDKSIIKLILPCLTQSGDNIIIRCGTRETRFGSAPKFTNN